MRIGRRDGLKMAMSTSTLAPQSEDAITKHLAIHRRVTAREFPWDYGRGLELAMLRNCCVPSIADVLATGGEFRKRGHKRYDDTRILLRELVRNGYESEHGRQALRQINRAHRPYEISNDDMLYVLSTFVFEPVRWIDRWAWRSMTEREKLAGFHFYRAIGGRLGVTGIPESYTEFEQFNLQYEYKRFANTANTRRLGAEVLDVYVSMYGRPVRPAVRRLWSARLDSNARAALGISPTPHWAKLLNALILHGHAGLECRAPKWCAKAFARPDDRSYPEGYRLCQIGPNANTSTATRTSAASGQPFSRSASRQHRR